MQAFSLLAEERQRQSMELQLSTLQTTLAKTRTSYERARDTHQRAGTLINALRMASESFVDERVTMLMPLLRRLYARVRPHPAFDQIALESRVEGRRGLLVTRLTNTESNKTISEPGDYWSSSQINALAVVLFLALNLSSGVLPLDVAILDDPLQILDDINLLSVVDILRRMRGRRQLLLSTHDVRLADVVQRKLRPAHEHERTIRVDLEQSTNTDVEAETHDNRFRGPVLKVVGL